MTRTERYESGMMLPPVTPEQQWLEVERILADIIDQEGQPEFDGSIPVMSAEGVWINGYQEERSFRLRRYTFPDDRSVRTVYALMREVDGGEYEAYLINPTERGGAILAQDVRQERSLSQHKLSLYNMLVTVALRAVSADTHKEFEHLVSSMAAHDKQCYLVARTVDGSALEWLDCIEEYRRTTRIYEDARIHPWCIEVDT